MKGNNSRIMYCYTDIYYSPCAGAAIMLVQRNENVKNCESILLYSFVLKRSALLISKLSQDMRPNYFRFTSIFAFNIIIKSLMVMHKHRRYSDCKFGEYCWPNFTRYAYTFMMSKYRILCI